jgi:hypothetical protein
MKKLTTRYKQYLLRKSANVQKRFVRTHKNYLIQKSHRKANRKDRLTESFFAPERFYIESTEDRQNLLGFISKIKYSLKENKKVHISFKNTKLLGPSGTLIFVAELGKILDNYPGKITCNYPDDDVVEQLFQHIGLLDRLGLTARKEITAENVRHWNYVYGKTVDTSEFKSLFSRYATKISEDVRSGLFASMSEAVTNSFQHAYPCEHENGCNCEKGWWMFARQNQETLYVVMYDSGIGIPSSLEKKPELVEKIRNWTRIGKQSDTKLIDIAVESNRTSTRLPHRGKGLPEMLEFVKQGHVGGFAIFSRKGAFTYTANDQNEKGRDFDSPIKGTLIKWEIPLTNKL